MPYNFPVIWEQTEGINFKKFGYALRGEQAVCHRTLMRGTKISAIATMTSDGVIGYTLATGSVNTEKFIDFVRRDLAPNMGIFSNCSIYHVHHVQTMLLSFGIQVLFLPPYMPDHVKLLKTL